MSKPETIIIVGGLSAGPAAAAKARRTNENVKIILFEAGANISYATCGMPYALSGVIDKEKKLLVVQPQLLRDRFQIDVKLDEPVIDVDPQNQTVKTPKGEYSYDKLIWAAGARSWQPPIPNLEKCQQVSNLRTLPDLRSIQQSKEFQESHHVTVLGGGLIGIEVVENLIEMGKDVTLVEASKQVLPQWTPEFAFYATTVLREQGVHVIQGLAADALLLDSHDILKGIKLQDGSTVETDYLITSTGMRANSQILAAKGAKTLKNGALVVNQKQETSLPNIYAAGDVASTWNPILERDDYLALGTHSNKAGRTAGANAAGDNLIYKGGYGTAIVKIFDYTLARTGATKGQLKEANIPHKSTLIHAGATPGYYPNQENLTLEITYHSKTKVILGAEAFGKHGVDKRIDVLSTAIYAKLDLEDLHEIDLAYAPPFSPAKDPVVVAGFVAQNQTHGGCTPYNTRELESMLEKADRSTYQLIDLRNPQEIDSAGKIPNSINIPLEQLRDRLDEVAKDKRLLVYCAKGMRGYIGVRILRENGFLDSNNLAGGFLSWQMDGKTIIKR